MVEAAQRSGAVNTARHARDLGRRLMAVPGPITSELSAGCHQVIRDWQGLLVTSAAQVLSEVSGVIAPPAGTLTAAAGAPSGAAGPFGGPEVPVPPPVLDRDQLGHESARVLDAMPARAGLGTTRIAQRAGVTPSTALRCLGELASGGFVERCAEGWRLRRTARSASQHPPPARADGSATTP